MFDGVLLRLAKADLALGVDPAEEEFAVVLDHPADPGALDDLGPDSDNVHPGLTPGPGESPWAVHSTCRKQQFTRPPGVGYTGR